MVPKIKFAFLQLHVCVFVASFTGIFGRLISLNEGLLVWYRLLISVIIMTCFMYFSGSLKKVQFRNIRNIYLTGFALGLHWLFFYGSIKYANVSIAVVCFSLTGFFTALLAPFFKGKKISVGDILISLLTVCGVLLIFQVETTFRTGIILGVLSSALAAVFTLFNKGLTEKHDSSTITLGLMIGGAVAVTILIPLYLYLFPVTTLVPQRLDVMYLLIFSVVCTLWLYYQLTQILRQISPFTVNLTFSLEPIYTVILAVIIFNEHRELNLAVLGGMSLILFSVILQMLKEFYHARALKAVTSNSVA